MKLYEVEATRWYFSEVYYRVVANDQQDAMQRARDGELRDGVIEHLVTSPTWNGEEEYLNAILIETAHPIFPTDDIGQEHINCQYIGFVQDGRWDCGHSDLINDDEAGWVQLPLIKGHEISPDKPKSWIMWFEKWADSLDGDAYAEAWEQYEASGGKW